MPEKVSMTPQTVPSKPMNGPPATAVDRMIMPFSRDIASAAAACSRVTFDRLERSAADLGLRWIGR